MKYPWEKPLEEIYPINKWERSPWHDKRKKRDD